MGLLVRSLWLDGANYRGRDIGINTPSGSPSPRWHHPAIPQSAGIQVQLRQGHLPEMLRPSASTGHELQEEEVWAYESVEAKEEAEVKVLWKEGAELSDG